MLTNLKLTNFRKVVSDEMVFTSGINVLRGANEISKSSRLEAIGYALFGSKALRTSLDACVTWNEPVASLKVALTLVVGVDTFVFTRSKGGSEVVKNGVVYCTGQNETSAFAATLLGADVNTAAKIMFSAQGDLRGALNEGPKALSQIMEDLAGFSSFDQILEAASEKLALGSPNLLEERLKGAEATLAAATESLPSQPDQAAHEAAVAALKDRIAANELAIPGLESAAASATTAWQEASALFLKRIELDAKVSRATEVLEAAKTQVAALKPATEQVVSDSREALKLEIKDAEDFASRVAAYEIFTTLPDGDPYLGTAEQFEVEHEQAAAVKAVLERDINSLVNKTNAAEHRRINHDKCSKCGQDVTHLATVIETNAAVDAELAALKIEDTAKRIELEQACIRWNNLERIRRHALKMQPMLAKLQGYVTLLETTYPATPTWNGAVPGNVGPDIAYLRRTLATQEAEVKALEAAKAKLELALEQQLNAHHAWVEANLALTNFVGPDADTILALTEAKDQATLSLHAAQGEVILVKQEIDAMLVAFNSATALWSMSAARIADAQTVIDDCKKDLSSLGFNNSLVKKLRAIRPIVANKIWSTVLASVSVMFSQMRGETSVVTKETSGFKVNGQAIESLSGSTLDVLGIALRCSLLRTFVPQCPLLILDEPAQGCDLARTESMLGFLQSLGMTQTLLVTHEEVSSAIADNIIEL